MPTTATFKLAQWVFAMAAISLLIIQVAGSRCENNGPSVRQVQVGFGKLPQFMVEIKNNCPMCPVTEVHVRCANLSQNLVDPRMLKVLHFDDCVVNGGLPLAPMQKLSFNYTHQKFQLMPKTWNFQCE
ncbi:Uncharacterized protein EJ110_NYTH44162 [Nymphaea thermarum]|nr:Uncharacterized protein EJ110_NYTH44162 [Nymphaea thermarum]